MCSIVSYVYQIILDIGYTYLVDMSHTYKKSDCKFLIQAKNLPVQIISIGGIDRLRNGSETHVITSWDTLYANLSAMPNSNAGKVVVEKIDPKGMTDEEIAAFAKGETNG
jgi:hypothetical protein